MWNNIDEVVVLFLYKMQFIFTEFIIICLISSHKVRTKAIIFIKRRPLPALTQGQCALFLVTGVYASVIASALEHN